MGPLPCAFMYSKMISAMHSFLKCISEAGSSAFANGCLYSSGRVLFVLPLHLPPSEGHSFTKDYLQPVR